MTLFVTDEELLKRLGLPKARGYRILVELTKQRNRAPFPRKDPLFFDRRYWPAVIQWLNDYFGVRESAAETERTVRAWSGLAPTKEPGGHSETGQPKDAPSSDSGVIHL